MKKLLIVMMALSLLVGCANDKDSTPTGHVPGNNEKREVIEPVDEDDVDDPFIEYKQTVTPIETWSLEGNGEYTSDINKKYIHLSGNGGDIYGTVLKSSPIMLKHGDYSVSFKVVSTIEKTIYFNIDDYLSVTLNVKEGENEYAYDFTNYGDTVYEAIASFALGDKSDVEHDIQINDFSISSVNRTYGARIDHIGYLSHLEKQVVFNYNQGNYFMVCDASNDEVVYRGPISDVIYENDSNEYLYRGFFKDVTKKGTYYIKTEYGGYSRNFVIANDVYDELAYDTLRFLYLQRCGQAISHEESSTLYHEACHTAQAKIWTTLGDYYIDVTGGWHDAGDYGRYVQTSNKVIADLLFSYIYAGNKKQEILDEARYGLEWSLKMQGGDGGVYNKVTTKYFAGFTPPEFDTAQQYVLPAWTLTSASFAGVMGLAYEVYKDIDPDFASRCLSAHQNAISYLNNNPDQVFEENPEGFATGYYSSGSENDERVFAYIMAYRISNDEKYLDKVKEILGKGVEPEGLYANFRVQDYVLILDSINKKDDLYKDIKERLRDECDVLAECASNNAYSYALYNYSSGSNQYLSEAVSELLLGYKYLNNEEYLVKASEAFNYLLGMNALDMCFVYGYGYKYPSTTHSRIANARGITIKGALSGGVCELLTEGVISHYFDENTPIAKRFADAQDSYNNVEPAIYYNSAFVLALSLLQEANGSGGR